MWQSRKVKIFLSLYKVSFICVNLTKRFRHLRLSYFCFLNDVIILKMLELALATCMIKVSMFVQNALAYMLVQHFNMFWPLDEGVEYFLMLLRLFVKLFIKWNSTIEINHYENMQNFFTNKATKNKSHVINI